MDVPAAASGAKDEAGEKCPAALPRADAVGMGALTVVFAWLAVTTLRRPSAILEDEVLSSVLWGLSPLICAYLFFWTIALSGAVGAGAALARASSLPFLAAAVGKLVAPRGGAAVMLLATVDSASACGRALAERRRRAGTERSAAAAAASAPIYRSREEARVERRRRAGIVSSSIASAIMISSVFSLLYWFTPPHEGEEPAAALAGEVLLGFLVFLAGPWLVVTGQQLLSLTPLRTDPDTLVLVMPLGFLGWFLAAVSAGVLYDMIAAVFVLWASALGMAGFFGYGLAVEAQYKRLLDIRSLVDGPDKKDACSAHIDAATARCLDCVLPGCRCTC